MSFRFFAGLLRALSGAIVAALFCFALGWLMNSQEAGFFAAGWSLLLGPVLLPPICWLWFRLSGRLRPLDYRAQNELARAAFRMILKQPGPRLKVWVRSGQDQGFFWFEDLSFFGPPRQHLVVTTEWLRQVSELRSRDWDAVWTSIVRLDPAERKLRTLQILLWCGALAPLEALCLFLRVLLDALGFEAFPSPAFWLQRFCWGLRRLWFGLPEIQVELPRAVPQGALQRPEAWNSLLWGVWHQYPLRNIHPIWMALTHGSAFLTRSASIEVAVRH
jgi:hypothetical protein